MRKEAAEKCEAFCSRSFNETFCLHEVPLRHRRTDISETMRTDFSCEACGYPGRKARSTALISRNKMV